MSVNSLSQKLCSGEGESLSILIAPLVRVENEVFFFSISLLPLQIFLLSFSTTVHSHTSFFFYNSFIERKVTGLSVHSCKAHSLMPMHRIVHLWSQYTSGHVVTPRRKPRRFQPLPPSLGQAPASGSHESAFCVHPLGSPGSNSTWSSVTGFFQGAPQFHGTASCSLCLS